MALTSENTNRAAVVSMDGDPYPGVEARPLNQPDFVNIKPKNPNLSFRWVNRSVGAEESTLRLDQMSFAGFVPALLADCDAVAPGLVKNGKIIHGDLILMKIDRKIYEGALKYNHQRAVNRLHPKAQLQTGQDSLKTVLRESGASRIPNLNQKISAFRPNDSEIAKQEAMEDGSGRLDLGPTGPKP